MNVRLLRLHACLAGAAVLMLACSSTQAGGDVKTARALATDAEHRGDCNSAVSQWEIVLAQDPNDLSVRRRYAGCLSTLGELAKAMEQLKFVVAHDGTAASYQKLAEMQWRVGYMADARTSLASAATKTNDPYALRTVAKTLTQYGDATSAIVLLVRLPADAHDYAYYDDLASAEAQLGLRTAFEGDFATALRLAPPAARPGLNVRLGDARWLAGDYTAALPAYQLATSAPDIDQRHVYSLIADCQVHLSNFLAAIQAYNIAISATSNPADADNRGLLILDLARAEMKLGHTPQAKVALTDLVAQSNLAASLRVEAESMLKAIG